MNLNIRGFAGFLLILFPFLVCAQQEGKFVDQMQDPSIPFTITRFGTKHGLPQNQVTAIVQRKNGNLILSTANGLVEYDGTQFTEFIHHEKYRGILYKSLYWHEKTQMLYGKTHEPGFDRVCPALISVAWLYAVHMNDNTIYGADADGKIIRKAIQEKNFHTVFQTGITNPVSLFVKQDHYYLSSATGVWHIDGVTGLKTLLRSSAICRFRENPYNGKVYALSSNGSLIYEISGKDIRLIEDVGRGTDVSSLRMTDITFSGPDTWFISSNQGLIQRGPSNTRLYGIESHMPALYMECVHYDARQGCLFVGTSSNGLLKLQMKSCFGFYGSAGLGEESCGAIVNDREGNIYIAGSQGNIYKVGQQGVHLYGTMPFAISTLTFSKAGTLFIGTWGGSVYEYKNGKKIDSISLNQLGKSSVHAIFRDSKGELWLGLNKGLAKGTDPGYVRRAYPGIQETIITIFERRDGTLCLGGTEHVIFISADRKRTYTIGRRDGFSQHETRAFYEDSEGSLWIGTYGGGVYRYANEKVLSINRLPGCNLSEDAFTLAPDGNGNLLITSNKGLWMVNERKLKLFAEGGIPYLVPFYYGEESGIANTEFNGGTLHNYLAAGNGEFWFPTIQGPVIKYPDQLVYRKLIPQFRSFKVNDTIHSFSDPVLKRSTHTISFDFYCSNYSNKFNMYYQYKLTGPGLPDTWSELQKSGNVNFKMLPPGRYVFAIRAIDAFNDPSPEERFYTFEIKPYLHETTWFQLLMVSLIILGIAGFLRLRYIRSLKKESRENKINQTILELKLKAIQSKMDPHFIFNSLNNIIYLLNAGKYLEAEELVHDFSLLLRRFLEKSDETFLSLREEFDIIDLYLLIEQKRFNSQFTYELILDDAMSGIPIPTLLIQPLVENAVKHGISHADHRCYIRLKAEKTASGIMITVEDNGIGLRRSKEINKHRKDHVSKGINLVKDKIDIMREKHGIRIELTIFENEHTETGGTISRLKIDFP